MWLAWVTSWGAFAADADVTRLVRLVDDLYLNREDLDAADLVRGAARAVASRNPWLLIDDVPGGVQLRHGDGRILGNVTVETLEDVPEAAARVAAILRPLGAVSVDDAVLEGLTDPLDAYSLVLSGDRLDRFDSRIRGSATEVGLRVQLSFGMLLVRDVLPVSPADLAGLRTDDTVLRIDGVPTFQMPPDEAHRRLRGPDGSPVHLVVLRNRKEFEVTLLRAAVALPEVRWDVVGQGIGRIRIEAVSQQTVGRVREALLSLADRGALDVGLVIDLRGNTGGALRDSALLVDLFVTEGVLVRTQGREGSGPAQLPERIVALDDGQEPDVPLVVLMDENTASGAEIVAGGLVAFERAVTIGTHTWGKGTIQKTWPLATDGLRLKMTVARYLLPGDQLVGPGGLVPDQVVARAAVDPDSVRLTGLAAGSSWSRSPNELWQVDEPEAHRDLPLDLAVSTLMVTQSRQRNDLLTALHRATVEARADETFRLSGALVGRADWRPAPEEESFPQATVSITATPNPQRFDVIDVVAVVDNTDALDLGRAGVALAGGPFDGLWIPIGYVPAGGRATGKTAFRVAPGSEVRTVATWGSLLAQGRPPLALPITPLKISGTPSPELSLQARLVRVDAERHRIEVTLHNPGTTLYEVAVHLAFPGDLGLELTNPGGSLAQLPGGTSERVDLGVRVAADAPSELPLRLVVESVRFGTLLDVPVSLARDGQVSVVGRPTLQSNVPESAPAGRHELVANAHDDDGIVHLTVTLNGQRLAWAGGGRDDVTVQTTLDLEPGGNSVDLWAMDSAGVERKQRLWVWAEEDGVVAP